MTHSRDTEYPVRTPPELRGEPAERYPVIIIGAGPIGLSAAIDLAMRGVASVVLDDNNVVSIGSRAICWAKRSLEIFDRLGIGERMVEKGVTWKTGRLFNGDDEVFHFDLLPDDGHKMPAFINLQQYYVEQYLIERAADFPELIDLRFKNKVLAHEVHADHARVHVDTPGGQYWAQAEYVLACDGARSPTRERMGLSFDGQSFEERFLIADVRMDEAPFDNDGTPERWFWFRPRFHSGQSALLHKQPDNIYRIDLQLGPDADPEFEKQPEQVIPRIQAMVGEKPFELDWVSVYRFTCARLQQFVHGRLVFVGDSAHVVSPFGARGGNGGIHDVDNLCWKLAAVLSGDAPASLINSYEEERGHGADENIRHSAQATRFMSPEGEIETVFRDEVLDLAQHAPFARSLINSGRLSSPCSLAGLSLVRDVAQSGRTGRLSSRDDVPMQVGMAALDAPLGNGRWLLNELGNGFSVVAVDDVLPDVSESITALSVAGQETLLARYGSGVHLFRPDQHLIASWAPGQANRQTIERAVQRAIDSSPHHQQAIA